MGVARHMMPRANNPFVAKFRAHFAYAGIHGMGMKVHIEFAGGAELLFNKVKQHDIDLPVQPNSKPWTLKDLIAWIRDNLLQERPELFVLGETIRPGILVLVNNTDWEILGELEYEVQEGDNVVFISTLHGG